MNIYKLLTLSTVLLVATSVSAFKLYLWNETGKEAEIPEFNEYKKQFEWVKIPSHTHAYDVRIPAPSENKLKPYEEILRIPGYKIVARYSSTKTGNSSNYWNKPQKVTYKVYASGKEKSLSRFETTDHKGVTIRLNKKGEPTISIEKH